MKGLVLTACLFVSLLAGSAAAGFDVTLTPQYPPNGAGESESRQFTPRQDSVLRGDYRIVMDATSQTSLRDFSVAIASEESSIPSPGTPGVVDRTYALNTKSSDRIILPWSTTSLTPANGIYSIVGTARSHGGAEEIVTISNLRVDNRPREPLDVKALLKETDARLTWDLNPEPDIIGYKVLRAENGGPFVQTAAPCCGTFTDKSLPVNTSIQYRVVAIRRSVVTPGGIESSPSKITPPLAILTADGGQPTAIETFTAEVVPGAVGPTVNAPRRDIGFDPLLDFGREVPTPAQLAATEQAQQEDGSALLAPARAIAQTVAKTPFFAASLLMVVMAAHMLRARRLLTASCDPQPAWTERPPLRSKVRSLTTNLKGLPEKSKAALIRFSRNRSH